MSFVGYISFSFDDPVELSQALEEQEFKIRAYCDLYGLNLVGIYMDEVGRGEGSLRGRSRPGLDAVKMRQDIKGIVVSRLDRLTRNVSELYGLLNAPLYGLELHCVHERIDSSTASGRLMLNILTSVAAWEVELTWEQRTAFIEQQQTAKKENPLFKTPPFGYAWVDGELEPLPKEQRILDTMKELRDDGHTYVHIAEELTERGYRTKSGAKWYPSSVRDQLLKAPAREERICKKGTKDT